MRKVSSRIRCLIVAFAMMLSLLVPNSTYASENQSNAVQIEKNSSNNEDGYAYYDVDAGTLSNSVSNSYSEGGKGSIEISKKITATDTENEFDINLVVSTTEDFSNLELSADAAVVLVLDCSGSMQWDLDGKGYCMNTECENYGQYVDGSQCPWYHYWGQQNGLFG